MKIRILLWKFLSNLYPFFLRKIYKMNIGENVVISYKATLDKSINPRGIHIGDNTWILANAVILAHDHCRNLRTNTYIGKNSVIGMNSIVMLGIKIGNHVVVGAGSIVTKDIPDHCIVVGNPAKILKENISVDNKGQIVL